MYFCTLKFNFKDFFLVQLFVLIICFSHAVTYLLRVLCVIKGLSSLFSEPYILYNRVFVLLFRRKLTARITELEDVAEQLRVKNGGLEKAKAKLNAELKEITIELENVRKTLKI